MAIKQCLVQKSKNVYRRTKTKNVAVFRILTHKKPMTAHKRVVRGSHLLVIWLQTQLSRRVLQ